MELSKLSADHQKEVMEIIKDAFYAPPWNDRWEDDAVLGQYVRDITGNANSLALGLFNGGELAGIALGRIKHWFNGIEFCVDDLCVASAAQGRGLGSELVRQVKGYCAQHGIAKISLKTSRKAQAYFFYRKNGFREMEDDVFFELKCQ